MDSDKKERKEFSLEGVTVERRDDETVFVCPSDVRDSAGKTPCDRLDELLRGCRKIATENVDPELLREKKRK